jgi:isoleucyl-tRNA synthetase
VFFSGTSILPHHNTDGDVLLISDLESSRELELEGLSREVISRIQKLREKAGLALTDDEAMENGILMDPENVEMDEVLVVHADAVRVALRGPVRRRAVESKNEVILEEEQEVQRGTFLLRPCSL